MRLAPALCLALTPLMTAIARADGPPAGPASRAVNVLGDPSDPLDTYGAAYNISQAPLAPGHLDAVPIESYLRTLQARFPRFRYIVRRQPGVSAPGPVLPSMETTDLALGEFVNYVNANCPGVDITPDKSVSGVDPLYVVTLSPATAPTPAAAPHVVRAVSVRAAVQVQQRVRSEDSKAALADVMSLVQVMVDASPDGRSVKLKVHEPTGMLIFDGPAPLADAVAAAVETMSKLTPEQGQLLLVDLSKLANAQTEAENLRAELVKTKAVADQFQSVKQAMELRDQEIADLQRQLAAYQAGPAKK